MDQMTEPAIETGASMFIYLLMPQLYPLERVLGNKLGLCLEYLGELGVIAIFQCLQS